MAVVDYMIPLTIAMIKNIWSCYGVSYVKSIFRCIDIYLQVCLNHSIIFLGHCEEAKFANGHKIELTSEVLFAWEQ